MEALLLYRTGSQFSTFKEGLKLEGVRLRELVWSPTLNIEDIAWGLKTICIYLDHDKTMLSVAVKVSKCFPQAHVFVFEEEQTMETKIFCEQNGLTELIIGPWNVMSIAHALKVKLMNEGEQPNNGFEVGMGFTLDAQQRCVRSRSSMILLRNKEYELLEFLVLHRGRLVTRTSLIDNVWDRNSKISSNTLDVHIGRLRKKLECPFKTKFIHTVHSIGYRFDCGT